MILLTESYKRAGIVSMVNRALTICSNYTTLDNEFTKIRKTAFNNDYPITFIDNIIGTRLGHYFNKFNGIINPPTIGRDKKQIYVEILYVGTSTNEFKKKIHHLSSILRPDLDIHFYCKPPPSIQMSFQTKDPIINYKTERQSIRRLIEHGAAKTTFQHLSTNLSSVDQPNTDNLRRSSRIRNKTQAKTTTTTYTRDKDNISSAVNQHEFDTGHHMNWSDFTVVCQDNHPLKIFLF